MSKLTKKQTKQLEGILYHLKRAEKYLFSAETVVAKVQATYKLEEPEHLSIAHGWVQTPSNHDQRLINEALEGTGWFSPERLANL